MCSIDSGGVSAGCTGSLGCILTFLQSLRQEDRARFTTGNLEYSDLNKTSDKSFHGGKRSLLTVGTVFRQVLHNDNRGIGKGQLMRRRLRLFIGEDECVGTELRQPEVAIQLEEFTRILSDAIIWDRSWVKDLADEEIKISSDLYEVLMAYSQMRPSA